MTDVLSALFALPFIVTGVLIVGWNISSFITARRRG